MKDAVKKTVKSAVRPPAKIPCRIPTDFETLPYVMDEITELGAGTEIVGVTTIAIVSEGFMSLREAVQRILEQKHQKGVISFVILGRLPRVDATYHVVCRNIEFSSHPDLEWLQEQQADTLSPV